MKLMIGIATGAALALSGCGKRAIDPPGGPPHGRYVGVGHFSPGPVWAEIAHATQPKDDAAARLKDDEQIIVVMDSETGEVRQCGNLSGVCVAMNPWSKPVAPSETAPVLVAKHADQIQEMSVNATTGASAK